MIEQLFNNTLFVGIFSGVVSGVLVWFITQKVLTKKVDGEYLRKVEQANNEILYALRPSIAGKSFPSISAIESVIFATSKKYNLDDKELLDIKAISNILIKEVMENSFLSPNQKKELCNSLLVIGKNRKSNKGISNPIQNRRIENYTKILTVTVGIMTGLTTTFSSALVLRSVDGTFRDYITTTAMIPISFILITFGVYFFIKYHEQKNKIEKVRMILNDATSNLRRMTNTLSHSE